ncbi:hypothetical protein LCGC14_0096000 [marine sediment metagenome]|uniref:DUF3352 domain-containing protein n=1 Tax=marine sediment metagenome TaxID=412755 RepID=A0A0F9XWB4_9ZZZZ|nr:hypothetical protein [Phycisphaerae bacterium]
MNRCGRNVANHGKLLAGGVLLAVIAAGWLCLGPGAIQAGPVGEAGAAPASSADGLASMIPPEAIFYVERRGHHAVREAFLDSNFGKMATDEAINAFAHASRIRIGQLIVKELFDLETDDEVVEYQMILHQFLRAFWYQPAAMYVVVPRDEDDDPQEPKFGFICRTGEYQAECKAALDKLTAIGLPEGDEPATRQTFTYEGEGIAWDGVAKDRREWSLPDAVDEQRDVLVEKTLFMVHWEGDTLLLATGLEAADAMGRLLAAKSAETGGKRFSKAGNVSLNKVMEKTEIEDWAFRWYFDMAQMWELLGVDEHPEDFTWRRSLGLDKIEGIGGMGGYVDKVYARKTFIHSPETTDGLLRLFKTGASYKEALAMTPDTSSLFLAGQIDTQTLAKMLHAALGGGQDDPPTIETETETIELFQGPEQGPRIIQTIDEPATQSGDDEADKEAQALAAIDELLAASNGNASVYLGDIRGGLMPMMMGGAPIGLVIGLSDHAAGLRAVDKLIDLAGGEMEADSDAAPAPPGPPGAMPQPSDARPRQYRNVPIRYLPGMIYAPVTRLAVMSDRIVLGFSDDVLKTAIDTALDDVGGFRQGSKGPALAALSGEGPVLFSVNLADFAQAFWPMLMEAFAEEEDAPLAELPSAAKMVRMLGPEVSVFKPDDEGLLLDSRGKIPLATKIVPCSPLLTFGLMWMAF